MSDTYARVMRPADGPENRRTTRPGAARRQGAKPGRSAASPQAQPAPAGGAGTPADDFGSPAESTFAAAVTAFTAGRDAQAERDLIFEDVPAPKRLAPYATAIAATVQRDGADVAWGRLVLLYDPDGQDGWDGVFRLVAYIRAEVEPEIAADPLLGEVGWSWLSEALDAHVPGYAVPSGTVTRVITEGFGAKRDELPLTGFELRASWSPAGPTVRHPPSPTPPCPTDGAAVTWTPSTCRRTSRPGATACPPRPAWNRKVHGRCGRRGEGERRQ
jgi:hypothetical protein